jgi:Arabinose efflux permease
LKGQKAEGLWHRLSQVATRRIGVMLFLGFSSGLPLVLTAGTLQAWLTVEGVDTRTIGLFTLVGLPYTLKFLWSPLMDCFVPPFLGRRRGWMLATQLALMMSLAAMATVSPLHDLWMLAGLALTVAFLSASQDIAFDAYRADVLKPRERGLGAAVSVTGYRMAMLVSGALALVLSDYIGWRITYLSMAALMTVGMLATLTGPEPRWAAGSPATLCEAVFGPLVEFLAREGAISLLLLIILYKMGDAFAGTLTTNFLIGSLGFSASEVGIITKGLGLAALLLGALAGGLLMAHLGLYTSLLLFGLLQAVSNLSFMALAWAGKSYALMAAAVAFENVSAGLGTSAFVAFLMALCHHRYTATQFALLSALAVLGRVYLGPSAGFLVEAVGWMNFFFVTFLAALPGLALLWFLRKRLQGLEARQEVRTGGGSL